MTFFITSRYPSIYLSIYLSVYPSLYLSLCALNPIIYLSIDLSELWTRVQSGSPSCSALACGHFRYLIGELGAQKNPTEGEGVSLGRGSERERAGERAGLFRRLQRCTGSCCVKHTHAQAIGREVGGCTVAQQEWVRVGCGQAVSEAMFAVAASRLDGFCRHCLAPSL